MTKKSKKKYYVKIRTYKTVDGEKIYSSWSKVNLNGVSWGFYNGRRTGFENAFVATLRPLYPLLEVVLRGKTITFMESIKITGGEGYNTAIIPVLEALGCNSRNIKTYNQYN